MGGTGDGKTNVLSARQHPAAGLFAHWAAAVRVLHDNRRRAAAAVFHSRRIGCRPRPARKQRRGILFGPGGAKQGISERDYHAAHARRSDSYYYAFEGSILRERQEVGFISSIISIGLAGAIPLVNPIATKDILGAASAGLQGATKAYSDEVLFQKTVQVLATQMRARRDLVAADIVTRMRTLDTDAYPLAMALADLDAYYAAGTIAGALIEIQKTVGANSQNAEATRASAVIVRQGAFLPGESTSRTLQAYLAWISHTTDRFRDAVPIFSRA